MTISSSVLKFIYSSLSKHFIQSSHWENGDITLYWDHPYPPLAITKNLNARTKSFHLNYFPQQIALYLTDMLKS